MWGGGGLVSGCEAIMKFWRELGSNGWILSRIEVILKMEVGGGGLVLRGSWVGGCEPRIEVIVKI